MTAVPQNFKKGWCPGVLRPMMSGDGQIVRLRPHAGRLPVADVATVAALAERYGNGLIDLTRRANIQIRGVKRECQQDLQSGLYDLGLMDETAAAEAVRNIIVNPLGGLDASEAIDARPIAQDLDGALSDQAASFNVSGKFGFVVDGGGLLALDGERGDIRLRAVTWSDGPMIAVGIDRPQGVRWLRLVQPQDAVAATLRLLQAFCAVSEPDARMVSLADKHVVRLLQAVERFGFSSEDLKVPDAPTQKPLGVLVGADGAAVAGFSAAFGRTDAADLRAVARHALALGASEFRVSPWRSFYVPMANAAAARQMLDVASAHGFIVDSSDPVLAIDACPGAPACTSAHGDTRGAARALAPLLARLGCRTAHVSGCSKGCARSKAADLVLVGDGGQFRIVRNGTASGPAVGSISPTNIQSLLSLPRVS